MAMAMRTRIAAAAAGVVALGTLSACGTTMRDLPIPGTGVSGDTMEVKAEFAEALNLAVGAPVKVNGVDMGKVKEIEVDDYTAQATLTLKDDAHLREGARARLRYTTPLGELFVDVTNPETGAQVRDGGTLALAATDTAPTVENALAQASMLINGGGLAQLQTVTEELNKALNGHEGDYRTLIDRASVFLTRANATTQSIDRVLTSLNSLSKTLSAREKTINRAVKEIRPAAAVLRRQTPDFTRLLAELRKFTGAANGTVKATRTQILSMLREVEPVLAEFARNRGTFDTSLKSLIKGAVTADEVFANDYLNISLELHVAGLQTGGGILDPILGPILDLLGLGTSGLLGGQKTSGAAKGGKSGATSSDPLDLTGLLNGLLGGSR